MTEFGPVGEMPADGAEIHVVDLKKYFDLRRGFLQSFRGEPVRVRAVDVRVVKRLRPPRDRRGLDGKNAAGGNRPRRPGRGRSARAGPRAARGRFGA